MQQALFSVVDSLQHRKRKLRKLFQSLSPRGKIKRKSNIMAAFNDLFETLKEQVKTIDINVEFFAGPSLKFVCGKTEEENEESKNKSPSAELIQRALSIKESFRISDAAYHELHMLDEKLPALYWLKPERKRLSSAVSIIEPFPVSN